MSITAPELCSIADDLRAKHDQASTRVASLHYLCTNLFDHYGKQTGIDLTPFKRTLEECLEAFMDQRRMEMAAVRQARAAIDVAGETVAYLQGLPA